MRVDHVEGARKSIKRADTDMALMRTFLCNWQLRCNLPFLMKLDLKRKSMWFDQVESARKRTKRAEFTDMEKMRTILRNWQLCCNQPFLCFIICFISHVRLRTLP